MRSPADLSGAMRARRALEWALRAALILALLLAIRYSLTAMNQRPSLSASGGEADLRSALRDWSTIASPERAHLKFDSTSSSATRDWTAALSGAGTRFSWETSLKPLGVSVEPIADPKRTSRVFVAVPSGNRISLGDSLGAMDSVTVRSVGVSVGPMMVQGGVRAAINGAVATTAQPDSLIVRPVLVLGRAGWEGKFIAAALEEYGWQVNARFSVSPGNEVVQGAQGIAIDTSRYSAVIVVDSSAARYASAITQYVKRGGGLVALGEGAGLSALNEILPGAPGNEIPAGEIVTAHPRDALALRPIVQLKSDAIALEKRGARVAIAARRVGRGRVVQIGYSDVWRWRMEGSGDPVEDYRNWISSVVSGAAYAPAVSLPRAGATDPAPVATLYASLGNPAAQERGAAAFDLENLLRILFVVAIVGLVIETASRRLDGLP